MEDKEHKSPRAGCEPGRPEAWLPGSGASQVPADAGAVAKGSGNPGPSTLDRQRHLREGACRLTARPHRAARADATGGITSGLSGCRGILSMLSPSPSPLPHCARPGGQGSPACRCLRVPPRLAPAPRQRPTPERRPRRPRRHSQPRMKPTWIQDTALDVDSDTARRSCFPRTCRGTLCEPRRNDGN